MLKDSSHKYFNLRYSDLGDVRKLKDMDQLAYVHAHYIGYGIDQYFQAKTPVQYITMIREPVSRLTSYLFKSRTHKAFTNLNQAMGMLLKYTQQDNTLTESQSNILKTASVDNMVTRTLASNNGTIGDQYSPCDEQMYTVAKARLLNDIDLLMLTERFDESVLLLKKKLGLRNPYYRPVNTTKSPSSFLGYSSRRYPSQRSDNLLLKEFREFVRNRDRFDVLLYRLAVDRFEANLILEIANIDQELATYRRINRLMGLGFLLWDKIMPVKMFYK